MDTAIQQSFINPVINREKGEFIQFSGLRKSFKEGGQMRYVLRDAEASIG